MTQFVLTEKGTVIRIQTLRSLAPAEMNSPSESKKKKDFMKIITLKFGDSRNPPANWNTRNKKKWDDDILDGETIAQFDAGLKPHVISVAKVEVWYDDDESDTENDKFDTLSYVNDKNIEEIDQIPDLDQYLTAEVLLLQNGEYMQAAGVISRAKDDDDNAIAEYNRNPILDGRAYDVMFPDGAVQQYSANVIAQNLYSQVDEEDYRYQLLAGILTHRKNEQAVEKENALDKNGK